MCEFAVVRRDVWFRLRDQASGNARSALGRGVVVLGGANTLIEDLSPAPFAFPKRDTGRHFPCKTKHDQAAVRDPWLNRSSRLR